MRRAFADELLKQMDKNENIIVITGDLGFKMFDEIRKKHPYQLVNCGAAEQGMMDIACGLALSGKIPFVYSITPFLIYRPFETLRTYINHEKIPVTLVGSGRDKDYERDGISHDATDVKGFLDQFENIKQ
jgi:transketolase